MKYNVSDILNSATVEIFLHYSIILFWSSTVLQCFYAYLIIRCSTKNMLNFRFLMLLYIFFEFLANLIFFLIKPFKLFPFNIIYPMGVLSPMSSLVSSIGVCSNLLSLVAMMDCLIATMVERHFQIIKIHYSRSNFHRKLIYFILINTHFLTIGCFAYFISINIKNNDAYELLTQNVAHADILLSYQPSLFAYIVEFDLSTSPFIVDAFIIGVSRMIIIIWLLYENKNYSKKFKISSQTQRHFTLMFQTTLVQLCVLLTFGFPCIIWVILLAIPAENLGTFSVIMSGFKLLYPIADVIVVIITIKPYREEVKKMLIFRKKC